MLEGERAIPGLSLNLGLHSYSELYSTLIPYADRRVKLRITIPALWSAVLGDKNKRVVLGFQSRSSILHRL